LQSPQPALHWSPQVAMGVAFAAGAQLVHTLTGGGGGGV
jgi:hypothetical protein